LPNYQHRFSPSAPTRKGNRKYTLLSVRVKKNTAKTALKYDRMAFVLEIEHKKVKS
jgi:hypothetical protein